MNLPDTIQLELIEAKLDTKLDVVETAKWVNIGKCLIMPNTSARLIKANNTEGYVYSYEVIMRKHKVYLPKEGDRIHITKKDGTIDKTCEVTGFVTLRNWVKIWV